MGWGIPVLEFLGGCLWVGWFTRLRDGVVCWFAREGGSAALPRINIWDGFFFFFFLLISVCQVPNNLFFRGVPLGGGFCCCSLWVALESL